MAAPTTITAMPSAPIVCGARSWCGVGLGAVMARNVTDRACVVSGDTVLPAACHDKGMAGTLTPQREAVEQADAGTSAQPDRPWITIVWNDPINLMSYVTHVFMTVFGYPKAKAEKLMLDVHHRGKAVVSSGTRERMELDVATLHGYGLWATLEQQS